MNEMRELFSHKILEKELISDNLLYIKTLNDDVVRMYVCYTIEQSFNNFLVKVERVFKYPIEEEGKYVVDVLEPMLVVYEHEKNGEKVEKTIVKVAYNIKKNDIVEPHLLPKSLLKNSSSFQKKLGEMSTNI